MKYLRVRDGRIHGTNENGRLYGVGMEPDSDARKGDLIYKLIGELVPAKEGTDRKLYLAETTR